MGVSTLLIHDRLESVRFRFGNDLEYIDVMLDMDWTGEYFIDVLGSTSRGISIEPQSGNRVKVKLLGTRGSKEGQTRKLGER